MGSGVDGGRPKPKKQQRRDHEHEWEKGKQEDMKSECKI